MIMSANKMDNYAPVFLPRKLPWDPPTGMCEVGVEIAPPWDYTTSPYVKDRTTTIPPHADI